MTSITLEPGSTFSVNESLDIWFDFIAPPMTNGPIDPGSSSGDFQTEPTLDQVIRIPWRMQIIDVQLQDVVFGRRGTRAYYTRASAPGSQQSWRIFRDQLEATFLELSQGGAPVSRRDGERAWAIIIRETFEDVEVYFFLTGVGDLSSKKGLSGKRLDLRYSTTKDGDKEIKFSLQRGSHKAKSIPFVVETLILSPMAARQVRREPGSNSTWAVEEWVLMLSCYAPVGAGINYLLRKHIDSGTARTFFLSFAIDPVLMPSPTSSSATTPPRVAIQPSQIPGIEEILKEICRQNGLDPNINIKFVDNPEANPSMITRMRPLNISAQVVCEDSSSNDKVPQKDGSRTPPKKDQAPQQEDSRTAPSSAA
ncbi:hypothetical protein NP233_g7962 [Leucocoprinus birnbaumii]|uniref:Uncharacterized protein n=1 Tax=Leucocoprinus birnbaumii TaxID=56174 RepID=A0AAD5VRP1_9AGAR|nr:hypothetical protein NP233_g7962 [Leucocoprinus birnbaumii]